MVKTYLTRPITQYTPNNPLLSVKDLLKSALSEDISLEFASESPQVFLFPAAGPPHLVVLILILLGKSRDSKAIEAILRYSKKGGSSDSISKVGSERVKASFRILKYRELRDLGGKLLVKLLGARLILGIYSRLQGLSYGNIENRLDRLIVRAIFEIVRYTVVDNPLTQPRRSKAKVECLGPTATT